MLKTQSAPVLTTLSLAGATSIVRIPSSGGKEGSRNDFREAFERLGICVVPS